MATLTAILNATQFQAGTNVVNSSIRSMMSNARSAEGVFASMTAKLGRLGSNLGVDFTIGGAFSSLVDSATQLQKYETTMTSFTGNLKSAKEELQYVTDTADKFGVSIQGLASPFSKFAAAATDFSKAEIHKVFEAFVTASSALQLNMQEVNGVFLALQQIVSKGKLSMEELRLQLAERIPGAMTLAAKAAGMSMKEFESAVRNGSINMREWMGSFAELIIDKFGVASEVARNRLAAAIQRLSNAFFLLKGNVMESSGATASLTNIFNNIVTKFLKNEAVVNAFSNAIGKLSSGFSKFIEGIDDKKITDFANGLDKVVTNLMKVSGDSLERIFKFLGDEKQWKSVVEASKSLAELGGELIKIGTYVLGLPGDLVDLGAVGYLMFGKTGPARILVAIELAKKKLKEINPDLEKSIQGGNNKLGLTVLIEKLFGKNPKEDINKALPKITVEPKIEVKPKEVSFYSGFRAELQKEMADKKITVETGVENLNTSASYFQSMSAGYEQLLEKAKTTWDKVKGFSGDAANSEINAIKNIASMYDGSSNSVQRFLDMSNKVVISINQQQGAAKEYASILIRAYETDGMNAISSFTSALGNIKSAIDKGVDETSMAKLSQGLKVAAQAGVDEFTKMGKNIQAVLSDIEKKETELANKIKSLYTDIANVHKTAGDARFDLEQKNRTAEEQYQATLRRTNELLLQSKTLSDQAQGVNGGAKEALLKESNALLEKALGLSKDLNATDDNKISKAQAYKDQLNIINEYESRSVENLKQLATAAENELKMWQNIKREFENISTVVDRLVGAFSSALKLDINAADAQLQIDNLIGKLNEISTTDLTRGLDSVGTGVNQIGDTWETVLDQVKTNHDNATSKVLKDLSEIERAVKKAFESAGGNYTVSVNGKKLGGKIGLADGGKIPGYGGGDQYNADTERGEYVINKQSTSYYGDDVLDDINKKRIPKSDIGKQTDNSSNSNNQSNSLMRVEIVTPNNQVIPTFMTPLNAMMIKDENRKAVRFSS